MSDPTAGSRGRHPFSYSWVILATGFCIMVLSSGLNMSFGVFVRTLIQDYGWTTSMVSLTYSISPAVCATRFRSCISSPMPSRADSPSFPPPGSLGSPA